MRSMPIPQAQRDAARLVQNQGAGCDRLRDGTTHQSRRRSDQRHCAAQIRVREPGVPSWKLPNHLSTGTVPSA